MRKSPSTKRPVSSMKKQRSASPSQAMPRSAPLGAHLVDDEAAVLLEQRVRLVVGELAVRHPVGGDEVEPELVEQRADHRAGHAVAAVDDDLQRLHVVRVDEGECRSLEVLVDVDLLERAAARRVAEIAGRALDLVDVARARRLARPSSRPCRPSDCARRCTSARRRGRASRRANRASRCRPCRRPPRARPRRSALRDSGRPAPARSGACRDPGRSGRRRARGRTRGRSRTRRRRRSARRRGRGRRRP